MSEAPSPANAKRRGGRLRRWCKRLVVLLVVVGLLIVGAWHALTSSWFLGPRVEAMLSDLLGGKVTVGTAHLSLGGQLHLTDLRILVPSVKGPAGELLHVPDVTFNLDRDDLLAGRLIVQRLTIDDALLRLSEDRETGQFNVGALNLSPSAGPSPTAVLPRVELRSAVVQIGEHRGSKFEPSGEMRVNGSLMRDTSARGAHADDWYAFNLHEITSGGGAEGMEIMGRFNVATAEGSSILSGVSFEPQRAKLLPRVARQWWNTIEPSGSLEPIGFQLASDGRYTIEIAMDGIDWSLPVPSFDPLRDRRAPRMTNVRGSVVIHDGQVDLIGLSGEIEGVRYGLTGSFASVDASPGFDLTFQVERFDLSRNLNMLTAMPASVRELVDNQLIQLGGPTGLLDAHVTLKRAPLDALANGAGAERRVQASGRVELFNAEGTYRDFRYPLSGLNGAVEFDDDEIRLVALAGRGPSGAQVFVSGTIAPPGPDPQVDVEMYAINVPIDDYLRDALGERRGGAIDEFFNSGWEERLHRRDLFLRRNDVGQLSDEVMSLMREYRDLTPAEGQAPAEAATQRQAAIRERMTEIERVLQRPTFQLGGRINIQSTVTRERGPDQPTKVANIITLADASQPLGLVYEEFPAPVQVVSGQLLIDYDHIEVLKDLVVEGLNGGRATITGQVDRFHRAENRLQPRLSVRASDVPIDELLLRAIPDRGWDELGEQDDVPLSKAAQVVGGLRLGGTLDAHGEITTDERGKAAFDIDVTVADAASRDVEPMPAWESELPWKWPATLPLSDAAAHLTVHRHSVEIHQFTGRSGEQQFDASGSVTWGADGSDLSLDVEGRNLDLRPHLIDLASAIGNETGVANMRRFWEKFDPTGTADASMIYHDPADGASTFDLTLRPREGSLIVNDHRVAVADVLGALHITPGQVEFNAVAAQATSEGTAAGRITLDGTLAWEEAQATRLTARAEDARLEAPVYDVFADAIMRMLAQGPRVSARPAGNFDATFNFSRAAGSDVPDYLVNLQPHALDLSVGGQRFEVRRIAGGALVSPDRVELNNLFGAYQDGLIRLSGTVTRGEAIDAQLRLSVSAGSVTDRVRAVLPRAANQLVDAMDLKVGQSLELDDAEIRFTRRPSPDKAGAPIESLSFDGRLNVRDASMNLSIPVTELDGSLRLSVQHDSDEPWLRGSVELSVPRMLVLGRLVTDVKGRLFAGQEPGLVRVPSLVGDCYGGRLSAEGNLHVPWKGQPGRYDLRVSLAQVAVDPVLHRADSRAAGAEPDTSAGATAAAGASTGAAAGAASTAGRSPRPGTVAAGLTIAGTFGDAESRIGRGEIRVSDAELYEVPLAMWALQLSALTLPVSTSFREAEVSFFVRGDDVVFERLLLDSPAMSLVGRGTLNYESKALDMRFNSASKLRAPVVTPLWEALRDLFMSIHVTGTLENPQAKLEGRSAEPIMRTGPATTASVQTDDALIRPIGSR